MKNFDIMKYYHKKKKNYVYYRLHDIIGSLEIKPMNKMPLWYIYIYCTKTILFYFTFHKYIFPFYFIHILRFFIAFILSRHVKNSYGNIFEEQFYPEFYFDILIKNIKKNFYIYSPWEKIRIIISIQTTSTIHTYVYKFPATIPLEKQNPKKKRVHR